MEELLVQPKELRSSAIDMKDVNSSMRNQMEAIKSVMDSLNINWESDAADEYLGRYNKQYPDILNMHKTVDDYVARLNNIADTYEAGENTARSTAEGLPTNNVFD